MDLKLKSKPGVFSTKGVDAGTQLLLDHLESPQDRTVVADLGCGSGVIGMTLASMNSRAHIHLLDSDLRAEELAKQNVAKNQLQNVEVYLSDLFSAVGNRSYHRIYSNPPQSIGNAFLEEMAKECAEHLKPGGEVFWVVKQNLKNVVERLFKQYFKSCNNVATSKGYVVMKGVG